MHSVGKTFFKPAGSRSAPTRYRPGEHKELETSMRLIQRRTALLAVGALTGALMAGNALAQQQVTLRLHQMLPQQASHMKSR